MPDTEVIKVGQMLHGYSSGHKLLAKSQNLSQDGNRHSRTMSDLSGSAFRPAFDGYLTGYPLINDSVFAIGKTWFATELPRPGCVWTHTILIPFELLRSIKSTSQVLQLFKRPDGNNLSQYSNSLTLPSETQPKTNIHDVNNVANIIAAYYTNESIISIPAKSAESYNSLVLKIWEQQWPALRCKFSFCTGSLEIRDGDFRLDIQIIPEDAASIKKASSNTIQIRQLDTNGNDSAPSPPLWSQIAARDIIERTTDGVSNFLSKYASDGEPQKSDFARYCKCFISLNEQYNDAKTTPKRSIESVIKQFPKPKDGRSLKIALFGPPERRDFFNSVPEIEILETVLTTHEIWASIDSSAISLNRRIHTSWAKHQHDLTEILYTLIKNEPSQQASFLANAIAEIIDEVEFSKIVEHKPSVAIKLATENVYLVLNTRLWKSNKLKPTKLGPRLAEAAENNNDFLKQLSEIWISTRRKDCILYLHKNIGTTSTKCLLSLPSKTFKKLDICDPEILQIFSRDRNICIEALRSQSKICPEAAIACAIALGSDSTHIDSMTLEGWLKALKRTPKVPELLIQHAYINMLAVAFGSPGWKASESVAAKCFSVVYEAASSNNFSDNYWEHLESLLPSSGIWWDRCKRLRNGLLIRCVRSGWTIDTFLNCTSSNSAFEHTLQTWGLGYSEKKFLSHAIDQVLNNKSIATSEQIFAAEWNQRWFKS